MKTEKSSINKLPRANRQWPNFKLRVSDVERPSGRSMTVQDDSYTVKEILEKFSVGEISGLFQEPSFQEEASHDSIDLRKVAASDLVDRLELLEEVKERQAEATRKNKERLEEEARRKKQSDEDFEEDESQRREDDEKAEAVRKAKAKRTADQTADDKTESNPSKK